MTTTTILFDTDPGIDDAMALLMLARDPRAELMGITTVFGNASCAPRKPERRWRTNCSKRCAPGSAQPMRMPGRTP